jgi:hypothetical protein
MPKYIGSTPVEQRRMVIAITAADDCTIQVIIVPISRNMMIE